MSTALRRAIMWLGVGLVATLAVLLVLGILVS